MCINWGYLPIFNRFFYVYWRRVAQRKPRFFVFFFGSCPRHPQEMDTSPHRCQGAWLNLKPELPWEMTHRNRWFTELKNGWIFPWLC